MRRTKAYGKELREKVIEALRRGVTQRGAIKIFGIGKTTVYRWWTRYQREGCAEAKKRPGAKGKVEKEVFKKYVEEHPDQNTSEIGKALGISASGARLVLKRLGFVYKKKSLSIERQTPSRKRSLWIQLKT